MVLVLNICIARTLRGARRTMILMSVDSMCCISASLAESLCQNSSRKGEHVPDCHNGNKIQEFPSWLSG